MSSKEKRELRELINSFENDKRNCITLAELHKTNQFGAVHKSNADLLGQVINKLRTFDWHCK